MEDLAGLVLSQLQVADATSPYALLYIDEYGFRVLVAKVARVNGTVLFEYAYVDLHERRDEQSAWEFVAFADKSAAVYFGLAFMSEEYHHAGEGYAMLTVRVEDVEEMFERNAAGALVPTKYGFGFRDHVIGLQAIGNRKILSEAMLDAGLSSLLPVSRV